MHDLRNTTRGPNNWHESCIETFSRLTEVIKKLKATGKFTTMSLVEDEAEHSLEMHLPYIYTILSECVLFSYI